MLLEVGFHRAALCCFTGCKSSPYTEGALFYGEKLVAAKIRDAIVSQTGSLTPQTEPQIESFCKPGGT
jgi:hypothetical protein